MSWYEDIAIKEDNIEKDVGNEQENYNKRKFGKKREKTLNETKIMGKKIKNHERN